jgi:hypothetical protein
VRPYNSLNSEKQEKLMADSGLFNETVLTTEVIFLQINC